MHIPSEKILPLVLVIALNVKAQDMQDIIHNYDKMEAELLKQFETGISENGINLTATINGLGMLRSRKILPHLLSNLTYKYFTSDDMAGSIGKFHLARYFVAIPALENISVPLYVCISEMKSAPMLSQRRTALDFLGQRMYGEWFIAETQTSVSGQSTVILALPQLHGIDDVVQANNSVDENRNIYLNMEMECVTHYNRELRDGYTNLVAVLEVIGHIRSLKARPLILDYLRKTDDRSSLTLAHQRALRGIGLPFPGILRELDSAKGNLEWINFLLCLGWDTEGDVFVRAVKRQAAMATDTEKWKRIQAVLTDCMRTHPAPKPLVVLPPCPVRALPSSENRPDISVDVDGL